MKFQRSQNCSCPIALNEGDDFTCLCEGKGGNPPANVTWYKNGVKFSDVGTEKQTLNLLNVSKANNGTYQCKAASYGHEKYTDEKSCEVIVYCKCAILIHIIHKILCKRFGRTACVFTRNCDACIENYVPKDLEEALSKKLSCDVTCTVGINCTRDV